MKYKHNAMLGKSLVAGLISAMVSCGHFAYGDTLPVSAMDDDMFSFYCDDDCCSVVEGEGLSGGNALSCDGRSGFYFYMDGSSSSGTLTFKCRYDADSGENGYGYIWVYDGDGDYDRGFSVNSAGNWKSYSVDVFADESNPVCITFEGEVEKGRILISDFAWTPAPETVKISFHTRGGNNLAPIVAKPGSWVDLPAAVHAGWTFLHWTSMSYDTVRNEGLGWRYRAGLTDVDFYANWGLPISAADRDWVSYSTNGLWKIYSTAIGDESADSNVMFLCELGEYGKEVEEAFKPQQDLMAAVTGPAKFTISHCIYDYNDYDFFSPSNVEFSVLLDGATKVSYKLGSQDIETQMINRQRTTVVGVPQGAHTLTIRFAGVPGVRSGWIYDDEEGYYKEANVLDGPTLSVKIESIPTAPKATFSEWATACKEGSFWSVGDLDRFAEEYAGRIEKDNADYEARILHAVTLLAKLCESESLAGFCKAFGCTLDYFGMKVDGKLSAPAEWPSVNDMVDQFVKEAVSAIKGALQDLEAIPSGWTGTVKLKSSEYPVDEDIEVDIGDVLYARAGLSAILGLGYFAHAYDLSVDWVKAKEAFEYRLTIPLLESAPSLSSDAGWQNALSTRDGCARLAFGPDKKMYVRIEDEKYISALRNEGYLSLKLARRDGVDSESLLVYYYGYYNDDNYGPVRSAFLIYGLEHRELPVQVKELQDAVIIEFDISNPYVSKLCSGNVWYYVAGTLGFDSGLIELSANNPFLFVANNFIAEQSAFMSEVRNVASLETSKAWMRSAMSTALSADAAVLARVDDSMHAVEYDPKDNESINKARGLVRKALASIDGVQTLDVASEVLREGDDFDVSLLPSGGLMKVYLGALFSGKIKRDLLPTFTVDSDEKLVPIVESINDSTVGGLLPEFTMLTWNQLATNFGIKVEHRELTIKFDANSGVVSPTSRAATLGEAVGALPAPTREGYAFRGWFTAASEGEIIKPDTVVTGAITLYAQWTVNEYTLSFDTAGGSEVAPIRQNYGTAVTAPAAPTRAGYAFAGWTPALPETMPAKDGTFTAQWSANKYTVTFDANGGMMAVTALDVEYGAVYGELPVPTKENYTFIGWTLDGVAVNGDTIMAIDADHALVAQWTVDAGVVTFGGAADWTYDQDADTWRSGAIGHSSSSWMSIKVVGPVVVSFDQKTSSESGYDYLTLYVNDSSVSRLSGTSGNWDSRCLQFLNEGETNVIRWTYSKDGSVSRGEDCAFVRNLRIDSSFEMLTLSFDPDGGALDNMAMTVLSGYAVGSLPTPYREGYEFLGWFDADSRRVTSSTVFEESARLVAHWSLRQYYASFNANGGSGGTGMYVYYGSELTAPTVTRTGYTFAGWSPAVPETMPAYGITFYAQWTVNRHRLAFDANGGVGGTSADTDYNSAIFAPVVSREGYVFIGWEPEVQSWMPDADQTYTAQWRELSPGIALHTGTIAEDAVWSADVTHLVSGNVDVADGASLMIEAGAVVKFMTGAVLRISPRATCAAGGVMFTHANDNSAGVGVFADGEYGDVPMSAYTISGMIEDDEDTEYRYTLATLSGNITSYTNLRGHRVYVVSNSVTVASGATLAIRPGAILKFLPGCSLVVNGTLSAQGTRAAPIIFTSIKDDAHGGDTNGDVMNVPQPNDWRSIKVNGSANISFAEILYGGGQSSSSDSGVLIGGYGAQINIANTTIAHAMYDGIFTRATIDGENLIVHDCDRGINSCGGSGVFRSCVIDLCRWGVMAEGGSGTYYNCIITRFYGSSNWPTGWGVAYWSGSLRTYNCCVYSTLSGASNYRSSPTAVNNIIADPLFVDADNGDFRIAANSPCVDAGNTVQAPETDWYGQPRMDVGGVSDKGLANADGVCADIGIYEVPGRVATPMPDIAVLGISPSRENVNVGDTITVTYTVTNRGSAAATGTIRDRLVFKGADATVGGMTVEAATIEQRYSLDVGACAEITATFKVPGMAAGSWAVGLEANPYRDVFEQNFANNSAWCTGTVEVDVEALAESSSALTVAHGSSVGYILDAVPSEGGVVRITGGTEDVSAAFCVGTMPTTTGESAALRLSDGSILAIIPAHEEGEKVYVSIENSGYADAQVAIAAQATATTIYDVSPARIPNAGTASLTITGSGLDTSTALTLGGLAASEVSVLNSAQVLATFNVDSMASGTKSVTAGGTSKSVEVYNVKTGPKLRAWLEKPSSVRDGRVYTAYVCYANEGDSPMTMPVFKVSRNDRNTKLGLVANENLSETAIYLGGISPSHPAGVLKAGDSAKIPFYFQPYGSYSIKLTHIKDVDNASAYPTFGGTREYLAAMASAATRLNLRGRMEYAIDDFSAQALAEMSGAPCAAVSGYLLDAKTHEPIANATVSLVADDMGADLAPSVATTDETGYYQLTNLSDGEYRFLLADGNMLSPASTNTVTISSQGDINGLDVYATPGGRIAGYVMTDTGEPIADGGVALLDASGTVAAATVADGFGAFAFSGLSDGEYSVRAMPSGGYASAVSQSVSINSAARSADVVFALVQGASISGIVTYEGAVVTNGIVQAINEDGTSVQTLCGTNGAYRFDGIEPNNYAVRYYSNVLESEDVWVSLNVGDSIDLDISTVLRPLFEPTHSKDYGSCTTAFVFTDPVRAEGVITWAWDFDSDGIVDSTAAEPTWTYSSLGTNTVTLTITETAGKTTSVYRNCVMVERKLDTILAAGAIVFGENSGTLVTEAVTDSALTLSGNPASGVIEEGNVILGKMGNEWYCRRVVRVGKVGGKWQLETVAATWDEAYEQCTLSATGTGYMEDEPTRASAKSRRLSKAASNKKKFPLYADFGVDASVTVNPTVQFEYEREKVNGKVRERYAFVGRLIVGGEIGLQGTIGVKPEKEFKLPFNIVIPTPIPGVTLENAWKGYVEGDVHVKGTATIGGEVNTALRLGCEWEKGKKPHWLKPFDATSDGHMHGDLEGSASIKIGVKPEFKAKLAGTASAVLALDAYVQAGVTASAKAPVEAGVSMGLDLVGELNLVDWDFKFIDVKLGISGTVKGPNRDILKWYAPNPDFDYSPNKNLEAPVTVQFTDKSGGAHWQILNSKIISEITGYEWDLGNGLCTNLRNPSATYSNKGTYTVSLKAKGSGINGPYRKKKKIKVGDKDNDGEEDTDDTEGDSSRQSWDPNEVAGPAGVGEARYVKPGELLEYTIYFENKEGFDIADAQEVRVTNPLSQYLDWSTFEMGEIAFNNQVDLGLVDASSGMSEAKITGSDTRFVRTELSGVQEGQATWYMRVYDSSPDALVGGWPVDGSGFLPSNDDTHRGEGRLTYRVRVRQDAPANVVITNSATIVFDYNDPIETDPAWWNTVAGIAHVTVPVNGVEQTMDLVVGLPYGENFPDDPLPRTGHTFAGWFTGPNGAGRSVTAGSLVESGDSGLYANWTANPYKVRFNANGGTGTMADQPFVYGTAQKLSANAFTRKMYAFAGWALSSGGAVVYADGQSVSDLATVANSVVTLYAVWEKTQNELWPDGISGAAPTTAASEYNGYLYDEKSGAVRGTIQVKVGKPGKKDGAASVKATVVVGTKKVSLKAVDKGKAVINPDGYTEIELVGKGAEECAVALGAVGLSGHYGAYTIAGARDVFASKNKGEVAVANDILSRWTGSFMVVWNGGSLSVSIAAKGKVKVSGTLADGKTKVSVSTVLLVGEEWSCVSVAAQKANLAFVLWLSHDGHTIEAEGLGDDVLVGKAGALAGGAAFQIDADEFAAVFGQTMLPYLPDGVPVTQKGTKWTLPKAGKVVYKNGAVDESKLGENPCGLKLTYKAKDGSFKGSFKVYAEVKGKPKATTVSVTGFLLNGVGYGTATIKGKGSVAVAIE